MTVGESDVEAGTSTPLQSPVLDICCEPTSDAIEAEVESWLKLEVVEAGDMVSYARPMGCRLGGVETCSGFWAALRKSGAFRIRLLSDVDVRIGDVSGGVARASDGIDIEGVLGL